MDLMCFSRIIHEAENRNHVTERESPYPPYGKTMIYGSFRGQAEKGAEDNYRKRKVKKLISGILNIWKRDSPTDEVKNLSFKILRDFVPKNKSCRSPAAKVRNAYVDLLLALSFSLNNFREFLIVNCKCAYAQIGG